MRVFRLLVCLFVLSVVFTYPVNAQAPYPTVGGTTGTPFPTMPLCASGTCGNVCNGTLCPPSTVPGTVSTCTPFCNRNTGYCAFTCSTFQSTCTGGWGGWGSCSNGWQFRVCNSNPQLGQTQPCGSATTAPGNPTNTVALEPTVGPVTYGTIQARVVQVSPSDISCTAIRAVPTTSGQIDGTSVGFSPSSASNPLPQVQAGANYAVFSNILTGLYQVDPVLPTSDWVYVRPCWTDLTTGAIGEDLSSTLVTNHTLQWDIGYTLGAPWAQAQGGDVYASGWLKSYIPAVTPRVFNTMGPGGYPGVVTYGTSFDFDSDPFSTGNTLVSGKNWSVNATQSTVNYYDLFYHRFGAPTATDNATFGNLAAVTQPAGKATPYYITGDMTTSGNWTVGTGENIVFLVDGNLTIGGNINITPNSTGFVGFIVNGNITVASTVGTTPAATAPVVEGVYIASNALASGTFSTGVSTAFTTARFVGKGMFIADNFVLQRDLYSYGGDTATSAELFEYNPQLLLTMPESMKELPVTWQEVAP